MPELANIQLKVPWHAFVGTAWFGPQIGVIALVVLSAFTVEPKTAALLGAGSWLLVWLLSGLLYQPFTSPDRANARSYGELMNKLATLKARRDQLCATPSGGCKEATDHLDWVTEQIKSDGEWRWVNGAGYIAIWQRLHRAEEALLAITPTDHLFDEALYDELRLKGSAIPNRDDLLAILRAVKKYLADHAGDRSMDPFIQNDADAASALREVRFGVNDFRDSSWNGLLQTRNQTMTTLLLTNSALFALVAVAVVAGARSPALLAATIFYLVGAVIGLFNRLSKQFQTRDAVEDYGLSNAQLAAIPVYSGLAAVAGVMTTSVAGIAAGSAVSAAPTLASMFVIPPAVGLLVVAAAFGATPDLILSRLADASEKFKSGIASTQAGNRQ